MSSTAALLQMEIKGTGTTHAETNGPGVEPNNGKSTETKGTTRVFGPCRLDRSVGDPDIFRFVVASLASSRESLPVKTKVDLTLLESEYEAGLDEVKQQAAATRKEGKQVGASLKKEGKQEGATVMEVKTVTVHAPQAKLQTVTARTPSRRAKPKTKKTRRKSRSRRKKPQREDSADDNDDDNDNDDDDDEHEGEPLEEKKDPEEADTKDPEEEDEEKWEPIPADALAFIRGLEPEVQHISPLYYNYHVVRITNPALQTLRTTQMVADYNMSHFYLWSALSYRSDCLTEAARARRLDGWHQANSKKKRELLRQGLGPVIREPQIRVPASWPKHHTFVMAHFRLVTLLFPSLSFAT